MLTVSSSLRRLAVEDGGDAAAGPDLADPAAADD
jgi:hypothetical protein